MVNSLLDDFHSDPIRGSLCEETQKRVISELGDVGVTINPKNLATEIVPIVTKHTTLELRQYQLPREQFGIARAKNAAREAQKRGITSVEQVTVEIGLDVTIPGYNFVVAFWKN